MSTRIRLVLFTTFNYIIIIMAAIVGCGYETQGLCVKTTVDIQQEIELVESTEITETKEKYLDVWTIANVDIKKEPNIDSEIVETYYWNTKISVTYINDNWAKIEDTGFYIERLFISENSINFVNYDVPKNNSIKSYMDYRCITAKDSKQYELQESLAYTNDDGIRMVNGRYCIAVGSYYTTTIGQYIDVELENGSVIKAILADCKDDAHTDTTNRMNPNGSVVEFVVDTNVLDNTIKILGDISYLNEWNSKVINIKVYDKIEEF